MADQKSSSSNNRWNWEVTGFEPRKSSSSVTSSPRSASVDFDDYRPCVPLVRRYSISAASVLPHSELSKQAMAAKPQKLKEKVKLAREDYLELRQEASKLQEYSNAKLDRVTRYLGVLADKSRKLDQFALETEARISPLISDKKRLFNDLIDGQRFLKRISPKLIIMVFGCVIKTATVQAKLCKR